MINAMLAKARGYHRSAKAPLVKLVLAVGSYNHKTNERQPATAARGRSVEGRIGTGGRWAQALSGRTPPRCGVAASRGERARRDAPVGAGEPAGALRDPYEDWLRRDGLGV